ncbi:MAG TPA: DUF4129 domain-containing protein [Pseudonocardiaceae bacterium]|nr:DUF4129 domain-containing protein [Pseudonocardiaceae bacterium]
MRGPAAWAKLPMLLSLGVLLVVAVVATRGRSAVPHDGGLVINPLPTTTPKATRHLVLPHAPGPLNPAVGIGLSTGIILAMLAFLFGLGAVMVLLASLRWRRRQRLRLEPRPHHGQQAAGGEGLTGQTLLRGTRSALAQLRQRDGGPPGDAVQQAWLVLESAAADSGTERRPDQTSTEFTSAVLAAHDVDPVALATLRGLYQRARFGLPGLVTEADAEAAIAALERIAEALGQVEVSTP